MDLPKSLQEQLEQKLKKLKLSKKEKERITEEIKKYYEKTLVDIGEPVGLVAAQSICEPATQMILRAFHFIGMAELQVTLGLPRFIEIVDGRKKIKEKYMIIRLRDEYKQNKEMAYSVAKKIREVTLKDVTDQIITDFANKKLKFVLNKKLLEEFDLTAEKIANVLKKRLKRASVSDFGDDYIELEYKNKESSLKEFYLYRERIGELYLKGIRGIKDVLVKKEEEEYVIYTYGSNLKEVMKLPEVDSKSVYTNDIHEVERILGIEAAREVIVREIVKILETQGLDIDVRHILLLADVLTWYGEYLGVTRYGLPSEKSSALARAAFETPIKHFVKAAMLSEDDDLVTATENIMANQPIPYGTGLFKVLFEDKGFKSENKKEG